MSHPGAEFWGAELTALDAVLHDVDRAGVVVVGAPGAGKTSLVRAVLRDGAHSASLSLQCSAALADVAYGALSPFLAELDDIRGPIDALRAMQRRLDVLADPGLPEGASAGGRTQQRPVIVVEDCQFLDAASAFVLAQLAQNREAALLATSVGLLRGESGLTALVDTGLLATVTMPPLGMRQVRTMCESLVAGSPTEGAVRTILGMTGGSPRLVAAFVASAADQGMIVPDQDLRPVRGGPGRWTLARSAPSVDGRLIDAVEGMHAELTDEQQAAVTMLALAGRMPRSLLRAVAGDQAQDLAEVHLTCGTDDGLVELCSALYAEVLRATVPPGRSSVLLGQWQAAGGAALRPPPGRSVVWTIENGQAVSEPDRVAAGYEFLAAGDLSAAWALASRDAEPSGPRLVLFRAEVMLAAARTWSGRADLVELADSVIDEHLLTQVLSVLAMDLVRCGEQASPWQALRQVRSEYLDRVGRQGRAALVTTGPLASLLEASDHPEVASAGTRLLDLSADLLADSGIHPAVRSIVHWLRVQLLAREGQLVAAAREAALAYAEAFRTPRMAALMGGHAMVQLVMCQLMLGEPDSAERVLDDQREGAVHHLGHSCAGTVQALQGVVELVRGRRRWGVHALRDAVVDLGHADPDQLMPLVQALYALTTPQDAPAPGTARRSAVDHLRATGRRGPRARWLLASAVASLADDPPSPASSEQAPLWRSILDDPVLDHCPVVRREILYAAACSRDPASDHDELMTRLYHACAPLDGRRSSLLRKAYDPAVASDAARLVQVADEVRAGGDLALAADVWARVVMLHHRANDLRRRGEALRHLQDVVQVLGGTPTRYVGEAVRLGALTDREHEIVRLALEGRSNADIAEVLVVSPRTVEGHLYRVFTKLGISDRTELRDLRL